MPLGQDLANDTLHRRVEAARQPRRRLVVEEGYEGGAVRIHVAGVGEALDLVVILHVLLHQEAQRGQVRSVALVADRVPLWTAASADPLLATEAPEAMRPHGLKSRAATQSP